jgi:hypothetical protein
MLDWVLKFREKLNRTGVFSGVESRFNGGRHNKIYSVSHEIQGK